MDQVITFSPTTLLKYKAMRKIDYEYKMYLDSLLEEYDDICQIVNVINTERQKAVDNNALDYLMLSVDDTVH